jgi:hypothetical protein
MQRKGEPATSAEGAGQARLEDYLRQLHHYTRRLGVGSASAPLCVRLVGR